MDSQNKINIGTSSSLIDLKAELLRKQREAQERASKPSKRGEKLAKPKKHAAHLDSTGKNAGVEKRNAADLEALELEEKSYDKAKVVLEAKAKLYEKMTAEALDHDEMEHPVLANSLVNFQMKAVENYREAKRIHEEGGDESDWVEFIDTLGRTRRCHKSELAQAIAEDEGLARPEKQEREKGNKVPVNSTDESVNSAETVMGSGESTTTGSYAAVPPPTTLNLTKSLTEEEVKEMAHRKWELDEEQAGKKDDLHYEDVLFDEIRTHGVSYFGFSKDDEKRQEQIRELKQLSQQTKATREKVTRERKKEASQLKERLRKVRARKRARLGLPPKESSSSSENEESADVSKANNKGSDDDNDEVKDKSESLLTSEKPREMRPWDFGKPGVYGPKPVNFDELDAKWLKDRRDDRKSDFAPPTTYYTKNKTFEGPVRSRKEGGGGGRGESSGRSGGIEEAIGKYSNFVKATTSEPSSDKAGSSRNFNQYSGPASTHHYEPSGRTKAQKPIPIQDELPAPVPDSVDAERRGKGTEIPPPPTFEYYHGDTGPKRPRVAHMSEDVMEDAVSAGLRVIREQVEKQKSQGK